MYGTPPLIKGISNTGLATAVPLDLLVDLKSRHPIPVTISGSNNVTFTIAASATRPVRIWMGDDFAELRASLAYTWDAVSNPILDSTGAETTDVDSVLGVWYMYMYQTETTKVLIPSQTAPGFIEGPYGVGFLGHPGTAKTRNYVYVGVMWCTTAATPAFLAAEKIGFVYHFLDLSNPTTATTWTVTSLFTVRIPKLSKFGGMVSGFLETGKAGTVQVSGSTTSIRGAMKVGNQVTSSIVFAPFGPIPADDTTGELYALHSVLAGDIHLTQYHDIV